MNVHGLVFVGTRTRDSEAMARFAADVLGLSPRPVDGGDASFFGLADGSSFAVQPVDDDEPEERTVGFLVDDVRAASGELRAAGVEVDDVARSGGLEYVHFRAPDGRLYELVQELPVDAGKEPADDDGAA